jgi:hypothetical protein
MSSPTPPQPTSHPVTGLVVWTALLAALVAALGSIWLSLGMELKPCPLCYYQRACIFCVVAVLMIGMVAQERSAGLVALMGLGPAAAAVGLGAFHNYLEYTHKLECPAGIANIGTAPQQALVAEGVVLLILLLASIPRFFTALISLILGVVLGALMIFTTPPPDAPTKPYDGPPKVCRPPYVEPAKS